MSTDQPELSDFGAGRSAHEKALQDQGAAYLPEQASTVSATPQQPENVCLNCGEPVESQTARVIGDNNGCIPCCSEPECRKDVTDGGLAPTEYTVTTRIVRAFRDDDCGLVDASHRGDDQ